MADLAASGLTGEQVALVMELSAAVAVEARPAVDRAAQNKRAYDREYRKAHARKDRTKSYDNNDPPSPNERDNLTPTREEKPKAKALVKKFVLPADIPAEPWGGWLESRKSIRKSPTDHAKQLAVTELRRLRDEEGWPPGDVLNHCAMNSYQGIYPPKRDQRNERSKQASLASVVHRILGDGGIDRGVGEDAGPGSPNFDERGTTRALAARGG